MAVRRLHTRQSCERLGSERATSFGQEDGLTYVDRLGVWLSQRKALAQVTHPGGAKTSVTSAAATRPR